MRSVSAPNIDRTDRVTEVNGEAAHLKEERPLVRGRVMQDQTTISNTEIHNGIQVFKWSCS